MSDDKLSKDAQLAAEMAPDVGREPIGAVYAEALIGATEAAGSTDTLLETFDSLVNVLNSSPRFESLLASGLLSIEEKDGILDRVFGPRVEPLFLNFLKVVAKHDRLDCLRAIHRESRKLYDKLQGRVPVRMTTALPLNTAQTQKITSDLVNLVGGQPIITCDVDPDLIGGAVLRVGDTIYDGSIATELQNVRKQMIDRSVHEIQSRRDRFRNTD
jgi:F-type H+-transporting ATPase subunit delta